MERGWRRALTIYREQYNYHKPPWVVNGLWIGENDGIGGECKQCAVLQQTSELSENYER